MPSRRGMLLTAYRSIYKRGRSNNIRQIISNFASMKGKRKAEMPSWFVNWGYKLRDLYFNLTWLRDDLLSMSPRLFVTLGIQWHGTSLMVIIRVNVTVFTCVRIVHPKYLFQFPWYPYRKTFLCTAGQDVGVSQNIHWFNVYSTRGTRSVVFWQGKKAKHHIMEKYHCYTWIASSASVVENEKNWHNVPE